MNIPVIIAPCPLLLRDGCCTIRSCQFNHVGFRDPIPPPPPPDEEEERANRWHPKIDVLSPRRGNASPFNANDILLRIRFLLEDKKLTLFNVPPLQFFEASWLVRHLLFTAVYTHKCINCLYAYMHTCMHVCIHSFMYACMYVRKSYS